MQFVPYVKETTARAQATGAEEDKYPTPRLPLGYQCPNRAFIEAKPAMWPPLSMAPGACRSIGIFVQNEAFSGNQAQSYS